MSVVTGVVLICSLFEETADDVVPVVDHLNKYLSEHGRGSLLPLVDHFGGSKHPQMLAFGGGFNYLIDSEFIALFKAWKWEEPTQAFLYINPEHGDPFMVQP